MPKKFLKEVVTIVVGKQAEEIADLLDNKKYMNEFLIAKKLDLTINQTRNILYKISDCGLVSFIRKKDKKKGWYTYSWKIETIKCLEFLRGILIKKIDQINNQIKNRETKEFYVCERCNIEFNEENALLYNFTCSECGGIFTIKDNTKFLKELKKNSEKLKRELALVDEEIEKEKERIEKERLKEIKKREKEKKIGVLSKKRVSKKKLKKKLVRIKPLKKRLVRKRPVKKKIKKQIKDLHASFTPFSKKKLPKRKTWRKIKQKSSKKLIKKKSPRKKIKKISKKKIMKRFIKKIKRKK